MPYSRLLLPLAFLLLSLSLSLAAESGEPAAAMTHQQAQDPPPSWLDERLGDYIPLDARFTDSQGRDFKLGDFIDRPTLVVPVYYRCRNVCNLMLGGLAEALPGIKLEAGEDYRILAFSIDTRETIEEAAHSKRTFLTAAGGTIPADSWAFLTGDERNIRLVTDSAGYRFQRKGEDFLHPVAAFVVSKEGKIVRYLNGYSFAPLNLTMALIEASENRIGKPVRAALQFCFSYDPQGRQYTFNLLRISATVILLTLGSFLLFLIFGSRKKKS